MLTQIFPKMLTNYQSRVSILVSVLAALLLAGCINVQTNLALYGQEQWSGVQAITLTSDFVALMESEGSDLSSELGTETEGLDEWLQQAQSATNSENVNVSFDQVEGDDGSLSYVLQADGSQYAVLNEVLFQGQADISVAEVNGQRQVTIRYDAAAATEGGATPTDQADAELSAEMMELFGFSIVTRISGGEIISHNADRVEGNTAIWDTPRLVEITLTEAAQLDPASITPSEPPAGSGPSLATLLTTIESDGNLPTVPPAAENLIPATEVTNEIGQTTGGEANQAPNTMSDTTGQGPTPTTDNSGQDATLMMDTAGQSVDTTEPLASPPAEGQQLPTSGAILPRGGSTASFVLGALVLVCLAGSGAVRARRSQK
jgi:hypothetical protein